MKYAIPLGALLLLGLASVMQRNATGSALSARLPSPKGVTEPVSPESEGRSTAPFVQTAEPVPAPKVKRPETAAPTIRAAEGVTWRKLSVVLAKELSLTALQQESVDQVLRDRSEEIQVCQEAILKAKLLDMRHYEWQVAKMKESWFLRIDRSLDSTQHLRFAVLADQGFFNDGLGITEVPGMTVLD